MRVSMGTLRMITDLTRPANRRRSLSSLHMNHKGIIPIENTNFNIKDESILAYI